jgi:gliding motility-associated-like protein
MGTVNANVYEYIDSTVYCNVEYTYKIEGEEANGNAQKSFSDTANALPKWDYTPPSNKLVRASVLDDEMVEIEWDSVINSMIPITNYVIDKSIDGSLYSTWKKYDNHTFSDIDKHVLVDDYSYFYRTYAIDECNDTSAVWNFGKTILLDVDTTKDQRPNANWSHYLGWTEDITHYAIEIKNNGVFTEIATFPFKDTTFIDLITDLNQRPDYCYRIVGYKEIMANERQIISISNEDCSPVKSKIYYPNAFSPNADNLNDFYITPSEYIKDFYIRIYNRWGEKIFESFDLTQNWDGTYKGEMSKVDAYAVIVTTTGVDNERRVHRGTITLVR